MTDPYFRTPLAPEIDAVDQMFGEADGFKGEGLVGFFRAYEADPALLYEGDGNAVYERVLKQHLGVVFNETPDADYDAALDGTDGRGWPRWFIFTLVEWAFLQRVIRETGGLPDRERAADCLKTLVEGVRRTLTEQVTVSA